MRFCFAAAAFLAGLALLTPANASTFGSCVDPGYMQAMDNRMGPSVCDEIHVFDLTGGGSASKLRLEKERASTFGDPAPVTARIQHFILKFDAALDQIGMRVADTTVLMTDMAPPMGETAHTWHYEGECVIPFYKSQSGLSESEFIFTLAHELFHCVQWKNFPGQFATYANGGAWWVEGTAEWFAHVAMPGTGESDDFVHRFDTKASSTAILDMTYENVVFFSWFSQHFGVPAVRTFIGAMPLNPGRSSQLASLEASVPKDMWIGFVEDYLDKGIKYPGGAHLPSNPQDGATIRISDQREVPSPSNPYQVEHNILQFERGHYYSVTGESQPGDFIMRWSENNEAWDPTPSGVPACNDPHRYRVAWGTTHSTDGGHLLIKPRGSGDTCPFLGTWVLTTESLAHDVHVMFKENCNLVGGRFTMTLNDDGGGGHPGTGSFGLDGIAFNCTSEGGHSETTINGTEHFLWAPVQRSSTSGSASTSINNFFLGIQHQGTQIGNIHRVGHSNTAHYPNERGEDGLRVPFVSDTPLLAGVGLGPFLGGRYRFGPDSLHFDPPPGHPDDPNYAFDFTRTGRPPRH